MATRVKIEMEAFVKAWEASNSIKEVSTKLGIKETSIAARASKYRSAPLNIPLKRMPRNGAAKFDVNAARTLLAQLRNTTVEAINTEAAALQTKQDTKAAAKV